MWIYRLLIRIRDNRDLRVYGEEDELLVLRDVIQALIDSGEEKSVTYQAQGRVTVIPAGDVESLSDIDPVIAPEDLPTPTR